MDDRSQHRATNCPTCPHIAAWYNKRLHRHLLPMTPSNLNSSTNGSPDSSPNSSLDSLNSSGGTPSRCSTPRRKAVRLSEVSVELQRKLARSAIDNSRSHKGDFEALYSSPMSHQIYRKQRLITSFEYLPPQPSKSRVGPLESYAFNRTMALDLLDEAANENKAIPSINWQSIATQCGMKARSGNKVNYTQVRHRSICG